MAPARCPENPEDAGLMEAPSFRPADQTVPLDWSRLKAYLAAHGHVLELDPPPRQFGGGMGNLNYLIRVDGQERVMRRPPLGPIPPGANDMGREHTVLSRLWQAFPLAPRSLLYCEDAAVIGAHFLIMEYRPGVCLAGAGPLPAKDRPAGSAADQLKAITTLLPEILAALHQVDPAAIGLRDFGRPAGFLRRAVEGWTRRALIATDNEPQAAIPAVRDWLEAHQIPDGPPALLHNDFKLDNVLFDRETVTRPVAVLDWDQATRGDPLFDLATLLSYWTEAGDPPAMHDLAQMPTARPGALTRAEAARIYAARSGRDLSQFLFYRVLALYKLGVVFLQLHAQFRRGTVSDPRYRPFARIGNGIIDFAHEIAHGRAA